ncbi:hypothetical protein PPTG_07744 [Phytophthora nicotianae INRA-310]|uniref:Uncharacterized protein n=1 Tax=Phytophthora nicotianae (strain INRA-310) TaxID=761204 RepID=W2QM95_PHYN3|nr:hypothetical protein PPTG_07744 [Phytophthora nicotianae INRA-310]ETN14071.1 hypothetical protein PPTG_07744 [Phytophthora nicotianae INRA-310]
MSPTRDSSSANSSPPPADEAPLATENSGVALTRIERQLEGLLAHFPSLATQAHQSLTSPVAAEKTTPQPQRRLIRESNATQPAQETQRVLTPPTPAYAPPRRRDPQTQVRPRNAGCCRRHAPTLALALGPPGRPDEWSAPLHAVHEREQQVSPNARRTDDNYKTWRAEIWTILDASNLLPPLLKNERIEDQDNEAQRRRFQQPLCVAQREVVMALSEELQGRFSNVIERADPVLLWNTLADHNDNRPGVNTVFLKRDLLNRRLQRDEPLERYIKDVDNYKQRLRRANQQLPEVEAVSILLYNRDGVYPAVVNEHEVRLARGESISWEQAIERLRLAEHARQVTERQQGSSGRVVQHDVAFVGDRGGGHGLQVEAHLPEAAASARRARVRRVAEKPLLPEVQRVREIGSLMRRRRELRAQQLRSQ